jgi:hypothetical protein
MDWASANTWAANLNYSGLTGWRLASNTPVNGIYNLTNRTNNGTTDWGFNITSPNSELAYMYYINLNLKGMFSPTGALQSNSGIFGNGNRLAFGQNNVGLVNNLQAYMYWSGTQLGSSSWSFDTIGGSQQFGPQTDTFFAWAVRSGDISAVPVPAAVWLFGSGLIGLSGFTRKRKAA